MEKGIFSNRYVLMQNDMQVGELINKTFSQTAYGELNGKKYQFITSGFFKQSTEIIDTNTKAIVGRITYSIWSSKATISLNDETLYWKQVSIWKSKWEISNAAHEIMEISGSPIKGEIEANTSNELHLLCGIYITNYYWEVIIFILIMVFVMTSISSL
ncbi:MAG: hypothetical protein U9N51_04600 [Bacteroidota bacterium]|nr:hypothetical protein [Bacteroidota bacterium]